jgi:hypothetical protein
VQGKKGAKKTEKQRMEEEMNERGNNVKREN